MARFITKKYGTVYIGVDDDMFHPLGHTEKDYILVLFHGTFIPLQGVTKIVEAAHICSTNPKIKFRLVGNGRDFTPAKKLADKYQLKNIEFTGMVPLDQISKHIQESDIVLGIFGDTNKAFRVIPNKVYEGLYSKRPVMTMDSVTIREAFTDKDMLLVKNDVQSMAEGIMKLADDKSLRDRFADAGSKAVIKFTPRFIAQSLIAIINTYA